MVRNTVWLDTRSRSLSIGDRSTVLQARTWQVLEILVRQAPEVVMRRAIVDDVWQGQLSTGEKGVNQAIWTIRCALGDDARIPTWIRTVERVGYQWIGPAVVWQPDARPRPWLRRLTSAAGLAGILLVATTDSDNAGQTADNAKADTPIRGERAYLVNRDIFVDMSNGCRRVLINANKKKIGTPVLSADGTHVAFTVRQTNKCRLVTVALADGEKRDFGSCPSETI